MLLGVVVAELHAEAVAASEAELPAAADEEGLEEGSGEVNYCFTNSNYAYLFLNKEIAVVVVEEAAVPLVEEPEVVPEAVKK